jgi:hypothetical protein
VPEFIVEYLLTQVRTARVEAATLDDAKQEVKSFHAQNESEMDDEMVIILKIEEDK